MAEKGIVNKLYLVMAVLFTFLLTICFINPSTAHAQSTYLFNAVDSSTALADKTPLRFLAGACYTLPSMPDFADHTKLLNSSTIMSAGLTESFPLNDGVE